VSFIILLMSHQPILICHDFLDLVGLA